MAFLQASPEILITVLQPYSSELVAAVVRHQSFFYSLLPLSPAVEDLLRDIRRPGSLAVLLIEPLPDLAAVIEHQRWLIHQLASLARPATPADDGEEEEEEDDSLRYRHLYDRLPVISAVRGGAGGGCSPPFCTYLLLAAELVRRHPRPYTSRSPYRDYA